MSAISFAIIGAKALQREFRTSQRKAKLRMKRAVRVTANNIRRNARRTLAANKSNPNRAGNFTRTMAKGIRVRIRGTFGVVSAPFPAHIIERGARPFFPPPAALEQWAASKLGDPRLAYPVARAIAQQGLDPSPFMAPSALKEVRPHRNRVTKAIFGLELFRG